MSDELTRGLERIEKLVLLSGQAGLTFDGLARYLDVSESTARRMAKQPNFPKQKAIQTDDKGHAVKRFLKSEIDRFLESAPVSRA